MESKNDLISKSLNTKFQCSSKSVMKAPFINRDLKTSDQMFDDIEPQSLEYEYEPGIGLSAMEFNSECEMIKRGRNDHCKKCRCNEVPDEGHCISCTCHQESG